MDDGNFVLVPSGYKRFVLGHCFVLDLDALCRSGRWLATVLLINHDYLCLFLMVPWVIWQSVTVTFPGHILL